MARPAAVLEHASEDYVLHSCIAHPGLGHPSHEAQRDQDPHHALPGLTDAQAGVDIDASDAMVPPMTASAPK